MLRDLLTGEARCDGRFATLAVTGISADSRAVKPGFLFVAVPGTKVDGLAFLPQAQQDQFERVALADHGLLDLGQDAAGDRGDVIQPHLDGLQGLDDRLEVARADPRGKGVVRPLGCRLRQSVALLSRVE